MPKITALTIQERDKERCNLFIDGEFYCGLTLEAVIKHQLKVNLEITREQLDDIIKENSYSEAFSKALGYVSKALKTKRQVKDYLLKKGYEESIVWQVIDKLKEYKYVDDVEYSKRYIESFSSAQGKRLVEYKLMTKGIRKEDIALAYEELSVNYVESAVTVAKKHMKNKEKTKENILKTYRYLIGKGFSYDEAQSAISTFSEEE